MYQRYFCVAMLLSLFSFGFISSASANVHYETRICRGCDYNHAMNMAAQIKPAINCTGSDDPFNSETAQAQACYATPINILVVDANNRNIWRFENTYANQGQPIYNLTHQVNYFSTVPTAASELIHQLLNIYEIMHEYTVGASGNAALFASPTANNFMAVRSSQTTSDSCEDYEFSEALDAAFDGELETDLREEFQKIIDEHPEIAKDLVSTNILSASFSLGNSGASIAGSWENEPNPMRISRWYGNDEVGYSEVVFLATLRQGNFIRLTLDDELTTFSGISLNILKRQSTSAGLIHKCLADTLDAKYSKSVTTSSGNVISNSSTPLVVVSGDDGWLSGGGGGGTETCKHTYYINGNEVMSFEGECP